MVHIVIILYDSNNIHVVKIELSICTIESNPKTKGLTVQVKGVLMVVYELGQEWNWTWGYFQK